MQELLASSPSYVTIKRLFECFAFCPPVEDSMVPMTSYLNLGSNLERLSDELENTANIQVQQMLELATNLL